MKLDIMIEITLRTVFSRLHLFGIRLTKDRGWGLLSPNGGRTYSVAGQTYPRPPSID